MTAIFHTPSSWTNTSKRPPSACRSPPHPPYFTTAYYYHSCSQYHLDRTLKLQHMVTSSALIEWNREREVFCFLFCFAMHVWWAATRTLALSFCSRNCDLSTLSLSRCVCVSDLSAPVHTHTHTSNSWIEIFLTILLRGLGTTKVKGVYFGIGIRVASCYARL